MKTEVLAAIIGGGAAIIGAFIGAGAVLYVAHKKRQQEEKDTRYRKIQTGVSEFMDDQARTRKEAIDIKEFIKTIRALWDSTARRATWFPILVTIVAVIIVLIVRAMKK